MGDTGRRCPVVPRGGTRERRVWDGERGGRGRCCDVGSEKPMFTCGMARWRVGCGYGRGRWAMGDGRWCRRFLFSLRFDDDQTFGYSIHRVLPIAIKTTISTQFCPACAVKEVVNLMEGKDVVLSSLQLVSHGKVGRLLLCRVL
jgi:hypothetical protein